jgi:hypothetical protein
MSNNSKESEHASAFQQFIDSIQDDLFVNKKAFSMSFLLDKFCFFLPPNIASKYATSKLQQKLLNYFGNAIIVEKQRGQGKSNTVFKLLKSTCMLRLFFDWYSV